MTLLDLSNVFTGLSGGAPVAQDLQGISSATPSTDYLDMQANGLQHGGAFPLVVHVGGIEENVSAATNVTTLEVRALGYADGYPPGSINLASVAFTGGSGLCTKAGHGLKNGQRVTVATASTSTLSTALDYYVIERTADTFKLATTPAGSAATGADATIALDIEPMVIGSTGPLPQAFYQTDSTVSFCLSLPATSKINQQFRYIGLEFVPGAALHASTGGKVKAWLAQDSGSNLVFPAANTSGFGDIT